MLNFSRPARPSSNPISAVATVGRAGPDGWAVTVTVVCEGVAVMVLPGAAVVYVVAWAVTVIVVPDAVVAYVVA